MTSRTLRHAPRFCFAASLAAAAIIIALHGAGADERATSAEPVAPAGPATGQIGIRLVRLLSEVPEDVAKRSGPLHDLRVELVPGNVIVFRKGSEFSALLPIDKIHGRVDSLRYFYYVEKSPMFWFFGGARLKGIRAVADGPRSSSIRSVYSGATAATSPAGSTFPTRPRIRAFASPS
jgi:hypothetical protein